ncbi:MAG TPA: aspartate-semialdehyde dehydrogenase [Thermoplasmata archaeon]|nr:aspartate-semialdehyde dehydrogenase [Thermoplasmata archaeon]
MTERIPCAVLGASGYIGQHFVRLLATHPQFELTTLTASDRSSGRRLEEVWQLPEPPAEGLGARRFVSTSPRRLAREGVRIAFSALPSEAAGPLETTACREGLTVFSNASAHRLDARVPLLIPEVNADHLSLIVPSRRARGFLVSNPNCTTTGLALALKPVLALLAPRVVHVATYQALSGAGYPGVASLSITDNVIPFIPGEEEKVAVETAKILGQRTGTHVTPASVPCLATCVRVAVRDGHLEAVSVEARRRPTLTQLRRAWENFDPLGDLGLPSAPHPPVLLRGEADRPQPLRDRWAGSSERSRGMAVVVGRIRWNPPFLRFILLSHNAVRGGAGGSVLNAELSRARGLLPTAGGRG